MSNRRIPDETRTKCLELLATGASQATTRAELARLGHKVSAGWLAGVARERAAAAPTVPTATPSTPLELAQALAAALGRRRPAVAEARGLVAELVRLLEEPGAVEPVALLEQAARDLRDLAAVAKASGALPAFSTLTRTLNGTVALCERLRPPPAPDPSDNPDVIATAEACRGRLHTLLDHTLAEQQQPQQPGGGA